MYVAVVVLGDNFRRQFQVDVRRALFGEAVHSPAADLGSGDSGGYCNGYPTRGAADPAGGAATVLDGIGPWLGAASTTRKEQHGHESQRGGGDSPDPWSQVISAGWFDGRRWLIFRVISRCALPTNSFWLDLGGTNLQRIQPSEWTSKDMVVGRADASPAHLLRVV
jgi:hypothetical protein